MGDYDSPILYRCPLNRSHRARPRRLCFFFTGKRYQLKVWRARITGSQLGKIICIYVIRFIRAHGWIREREMTQPQHQPLPPTPARHTLFHHRSVVAHVAQQDTQTLFSVYAQTLRFDFLSWNSLFPSCFQAKDSTEPAMRDGKAAVSHEWPLSPAEGSERQRRTCTK